jgi:hypothetical protein
LTSSSGVERGLDALECATGTRSRQGTFAVILTVQADPLELRPFDLVVIPGWSDEMKARLTAR